MNQRDAESISNMTEERAIKANESVRGVTALLWNVDRDLGRMISKEQDEHGFHDPVVSALKRVQRKVGAAMTQGTELSFALKQRISHH